MKIDSKVIDKLKMAFPGEEDKIDSILGSGEEEEDKMEEDLELIYQFLLNYGVIIPEEDKPEYKHYL